MPCHDLLKTLERKRDNALQNCHGNRFKTNISILKKEEIFE
jgi:hypothetical protein